jgi:hypothetical protein
MGLDEHASLCISLPHKLSCLEVIATAIPQAGTSYRRVYRSALSRQKASQAAYSQNLQSDEAKLWRSRPDDST